jgi:hypothetical protein
MPETTYNILSQVCPKKSKKFVDRWFILSMVFMAMGMILAFLALIMLPRLV